MGKTRAQLDAEREEAEFNQLYKDMPTYLTTLLSGLTKDHPDTLALREALVETTDRAFTSRKHAVLREFAAWARMLQRKENDLTEAKNARDDLRRQLTASETQFKAYKDGVRDAGGSNSRDPEDMRRGPIWMSPWGPMFR